jgi:hypothetical protein
MGRRRSVFAVGQLLKSKADTPGIVAARELDAAGSVPSIMTADNRKDNKLPKRTADAFPAARRARPSRSFVSESRGIARGENPGDAIVKVRTGCSANFRH